MVIDTRSDPQLPLARLRARGQTVELRAADLRFTEGEAAQFMNEVMGLDLEAGAVAALAERTEGWIAGLQMAALSMRDRKDVDEFIASFSGTNRYILDYLLEEVLAGEPPEIQRFLLDTSILERLTAALCDAVTGVREWKADSRDSASSTPYDSQFILEYLDKANLFLAPQDDARTWYRYHQLFADLLRIQLQKSLGGEGVARLHLRAAEWHEENGSILEAIQHASLAADEERVERLIEQSYMEMVSRGEQSGMRYWTSKLSKEQVYRRPWLCIYEAYSHSWFGELDEAELLLSRAEQHLRSGISNPETQAMQGLFVYVKSRVTAMRGDLRQAIEHCLAARENIPARNLSLQFDSRVTLGYEYFLLGDYTHANPILNETVITGTPAKAVVNSVAAACILARMYAIQGLLKKSVSTYQNAMQLIAESDGQHRDAWALVEAGLAEANRERNELEAALAHVKQSLSLMPWWGKSDDFVLASVTLGRILLAQAKLSEAREAVEKALQLTQTRGVFSEACEEAEVAQVRIWLALDDLQAASRWTDTLKERLRPGVDPGFEDELRQMALARVYLALNRIHEAAERLSHLEATARSAGRMGRVIEILLLKASALSQAGDSEKALLAVTEGLRLAAPEGYMRVFLDEGKPMQRLIAQWLAQAVDSPLRDYAEHLLYLFDGEANLVSARQENGAKDGAPARRSGQTLEEPLSQRELEVLQLLAVGKTNQEIAQKLIISAGTVKAHTASIYRKLGAANRTEAAARARQLGMLN